MLLASRITGSVVMLILCLMMVPHMIEGITREGPYLPENSPWQGVVMTLMTIVFIIGYIISWWRKLFGGILMVLAGLLVSLPLIIIQGNMGGLVFGLPLTIAGLLYIIHWNDIRKSKLS